jgi:hypothetical protein
MGTTASLKRKTEMSRNQWRFPAGLPQSLECIGKQKRILKSGIGVKKEQVHPVCLGGGIIHLGAPSPAGLDEPGPSSKTYLPGPVGGATISHNDLQSYPALELKISQEKWQRLGLIQRRNDDAQGGGHCLSQE